MGGKSGGGFDAGPMIQYGNKALALQERMYDDSQARTEPYLQGGLSGFNMLLDQMGIQGGSMKSRDQIMSGMEGDFTTTTQTGGGSDLYRTADGRVLGLDEAIAAGLKTRGGATHGQSSVYRSNPNLLGQIGVTPFQQQTSTTTTDTAGLNSAVDAAYQAQETPDNFGNLMENFSLDKFHADPGYQFRLDQGQKAIERGASARGQYYDPSTVKALAEFNGGMADQTYNDAYSRYNNDQNTIFNRLAAVSGIGQTANNSMNASGANYANQAGNIYGQMGSAVTEANAANASRPSMFDTLLGAGVQLGGAWLGRG